MTDVYLFYITIDSDEAAHRLGTALVREKLAACVNVVPGITSHYTWKGKLESATEWLLIVKTTEDRIEALRRRVPELHPYEVPELIGWPITVGHEPYLDWVRESTRP